MHFLQSIKHIFAVVLIGSSLAAPAFAQSRGPSTEEENARVVKLAAASEKDPLGTMTSAEGRWFEKWSDDVPDYRFGPDKIAFWMETGAAKGELKRAVRFQHTVSSAAYQVQHHIGDPKQNKQSADATSLAALEGLLHAYESLLAKNPANRSEQLDLAIAARDKGALPAFVDALPAMPKR